MIDDILLLKKIADYFQKSNKSIIANMINEELNKEIAVNPNFKEPDYVKEDLKTIFTKFVTVKRRQSLASTRNMSCSRTTDCRQRIQSKPRNLNKRSSMLINSSRIIPADIDENVDIVNSSSDESDDMNSDNSSYLIPHPNKNNRISENVSKSQFIPGIISTPCANNNNNQLLEHEVKVESSFVTNDDNQANMDNDNADDDDDNSSLIILDTDEHFHQTIYTSSAVFEYDQNGAGSAMEDIIKSYDEFVKCSQRQHDSPDSLFATQATIEDDCADAPASDHCNDSDMELDDGTRFNRELNRYERRTSDSEVQLKTSANYAATDEQHQAGQQQHCDRSHDNSFRSDDSPSFAGSQSMGHELAQLSDTSMMDQPQEVEEGHERAENKEEYQDEVAEHRDEVDEVREEAEGLQEIVEGVWEGTQEVRDEVDEVREDEQENEKKNEEISDKELSRYEIAIQCDPGELIQPDKGGVVVEEAQSYISRQKRTAPSDDETGQVARKKVRVDPALMADENKENEPAEAQIIADVVDLVDLDEEPEEVDYGAGQSGAVHSRSRRSSISSLEDLCDDDVVPQRQPRQHEARRKNVHMAIVDPFKDNYKLDFERRILLADGWILWPTSVLSSCFRNYNDETFRHVLTDYGVGDNLESLSRKDLIKRSLERMAQNKIIHSCVFPKKKTTFYLKYPTLSADLLESFEISDEIYANCLWNRSLGPKNGRKVSAENAPRVVKALLHLELDFVDNLIRNEVVVSDDE